jgi:hypothetical protein
LSETVGTTKPESTLQPVAGAACKHHCAGAYRVCAVDIDPHAVGGQFQIPHAAAGTQPRACLRRALRDRAIEQAAIDDVRFDHVRGVGDLEAGGRNNFAVDSVFRMDARDRSNSAKASSASTPVQCTG